MASFFKNLSKTVSGNTNFDADDNPTIDKQQVQISQLTNNKRTLKYLAILSIGFLLFSQLVIVFRKNFIVNTYPVIAYDTETAKELLWDIAPENDVEWTLTSNEKVFYLVEQIIGSWGLIAPTYLANFGTDEWTELIQKNLNLYFDWWFELNNNDESNDDKLVSLIKHITNKEKTFWRNFANIYMSEDAIQIGDSTINNWRLFKVVNPLITWEWKNLKWENCLSKVNKDRKISAQGVCSRKWYFLALRTFLLETLDKDIAFPIKIDWKEYQLKKFNKDNWQITLWYSNFVDFLNKTQIANLFYQMQWLDFDNLWQIGWTTEKTNSWLKHLALFNLVYKWLFDKPKSSTNKLSYSQEVLWAISNNYWDYLPEIVKLKLWTDKTINNKKPWDNWENQEQASTTQEQPKPTKEEKNDISEMNEQSQIILTWNENEKNYLNYTLVKEVVDNLIDSSYAYYNDLLTWESASIDFNNENQNGCMLSLADGSKVIYNTSKCSSIKDMLALGQFSKDTVIVNKEWIVNETIEKVEKTTSNLLTDSRNHTSIAWVNFKVPMWWILWVNKDWVGFWIKGIESVDWLNRLVIKQYKFNYAWPSTDTSSKNAQLFLKSWSVIVQILYFCFYFTLYFIFLAILSLMINTIYNYKVKQKHWE